MDPIVSIVIPTYNRAGVLGETIDSVLAQTFTNWELLVIDDGSTDHTNTLVGGYDDSRIQYYRIRHTGIIGRVRNYGMQKAKGKYIAFLDSDDLWRSDTLALQVSLFNRFPSAAFIFSNGNEFGEFAVRPPEQEVLFAGDVFLPIILDHRFCLFVSSWIVKREVFQSIGWLDETFRIGGDIDFFLTMAHDFHGVFTNERLVNHRKHAHGISVDLEVVAYEEHCLTIKRFLNQGWLTRARYGTIVSDLYYKKGLLLLSRKEPKKAMISFSRAAAFKPLNYKGWLRLLQAALRTLI